MLKSLHSKRNPFLHHLSKILKAMSHKLLSKKVTPNHYGIDLSELRIIRYTPKFQLDKVNIP